MEEMKLFRVLNRVNSLLFFLLFISVLAFVVFINVKTSTWQDRGAVEVAENPKDGSSPTIELVLGNINDIKGHDAQYVELHSKVRGGKFSSGYSGGETRNVLFLVGKNLETKWLFPSHTNIIYQVTPLSLGREYEEDKRNVRSMYYELVNEDTNGDGILDADDLSVIALSKPDGTKFAIIETGVQSVIDRTLVDEGKTLVLLVQSEGKVHLRKYSSETFELVGSKAILDIAGKS
jgi:hypothetical protein